MKWHLFFKHKLPLLVAYSGFFACCLFISACNTRVDEKQPNFIIIFDDQHNSKHMGWTGQGEGIKTPNIDRLASESVTFTNAYSSCPVCAPARHSVYTGLYPSRHGVVHNDRALPKGVPTMMEQLAKAGYTTANVGKMHFAPYNERHGFQYVLNHEFFADDAGISHFRPWLDREVERRGLTAQRYPQ
ncbi:MAG: sulfatase-like hydrolase/transferase, partial [Bacteroidetes bacterium]|nr:sulfatase-like hydrolase/transferase [Bacteroidota bacterium]